MFKSITRSVLAGVIAAVAAVAGAEAAGEYKHPEHHHWHWAGPFGTYDQAQLQRGFQVYSQVCAACHGMKLLSFRNLGEKGGPYYDPEYPNATENPVVAEIARNWIYPVTDGPNDSGEMFERPARPSDRIPRPYPNEQFARSIHNGAYPVDFSVITKARKYGADYVRSLLLGYVEPPEGVTVDFPLHYNEYFPGQKIAMAPPLVVDGQVEYAEGNPEPTIPQMAEDVATFLNWASDPHADVRKQTGFAVLLYLFALAVLLWFSYKQIWRNVKH